MRAVRCSINSVGVSIICEVPSDQNFLSLTIIRPSEDLSPVAVQLRMDAAK